MVRESRFQMWRAVFAMAHIDGCISKDEIIFMETILNELTFSVAQKGALEKDIAVAQSPYEMFRQISELRDQTLFFELAHKMVRVDGDIHQDEANMMVDIQREQLMSAGVENLVGTICFELEGDHEGEKLARRVLPRPALSPMRENSVFRDAIVRRSMGGGE